MTESRLKWVFLIGILICVVLLWQGAKEGDVASTVTLVSIGVFFALVAGAVLVIVAMYAFSRMQHNSFTDNATENQKLLAQAQANTSRAMIGISRMPTTAYPGLPGSVRTYRTFDEQVADQQAALQIVDGAFSELGTNSVGQESEE